MNSKIDYDQIAKIEKAIKDKYGSEAIQNPKNNWDEEKENKYLKDLKNFYKEPSSNIQTEELEGFKIKPRRIEKKTSRPCPVCSKYSFESSDDLYMTKFNCCLDCYIKYVEYREERWNSGWRPKN